MRLFKNTILGLALLVIAVLILGCGSGASNNQGVSFTLLGFFESADDDADGELVRIIPLSFEPTEDQGTQFETEQNRAGAVLSFAGVQNNLSQQFIRTDGMFLNYFIPGASRQPPDTATAFSLVLGPAVPTETTEGDPFDSSLPPSFAGDGAPSNIDKGRVSVVPADIMTWLNLNRTALPELPFDMLVTAYASGITASGDRLDSNEVQFLVKFTPDNVIPPADNAPEEGDNPSATGGTAGSDTTTTTG